MLVYHGQLLAHNLRSLPQVIHFRIFSHVKHFRAVNHDFAWTSWHILSWRSRIIRSSFVVFIFIRGLSKELFFSFCSRNMILRLPVASNPSSGFLKVGSNVEVLFLSSDLWFHPASSLTPLFHSLLSFFISSFVSKLFVFGIKPELFKLLFKCFSSWVVELIITSAFKSVLLSIFARFIRSIESLERLLEYRSVVFIKTTVSTSRYSSCISTKSCVNRCCSWCRRGTISKNWGYSSSCRSKFVNSEAVEALFGHNFELGTNQRLRLCVSSWWELFRLLGKVWNVSSNMLCLILLESLSSWNNACAFRPFTTFTHDFRKFPLVILPIVEHVLHASIMAFIIHCRKSLRFSLERKSIFSSLDFHWIHEISLLLQLVSWKETNGWLLSVKPLISSLEIKLPVVFVVCNYNISEHLLKASVQFGHVSESNTSLQFLI